VSFDCVKFGLMGDVQFFFLLIFLELKWPEFCVAAVMERLNDGNANMKKLTFFRR
jgi:hypothetical protein